jgi:hypothetical protein
MGEFDAAGQTIINGLAGRLADVPQAELTGNDHSLHL